MIIEAEIEDSTHLVLRRPLALPAGRRVFVEVIEEVIEEEDADRGEFLAASVALLERAYSSDEPDYSEAGEPL